MSLRPHIFALAITEKQQTLIQKPTLYRIDQLHPGRCIYFLTPPDLSDPRDIRTFQLKNTKFRRTSSLPRFGMCPRARVIRHRWFISCSKIALRIYFFHRSSFLIILARGFFLSKLSRFVLENAEARQRHINFERKRASFAQSYFSINVSNIMWSWHICVFYTYFCVYFYSISVNLDATY